MDKLSCMRAFVAVVETGGFSAAARRTGQSKALISKYVGQLESELGQRLLQRTTRSVRPTSAGQAYFERCRPLLIELDELDDCVESNDADPRGDLRVSAPVSFAEMHLMSVVSTFSKRYPSITVKLDLTDRYVNLVEEGIDVAIRIGNLPESSLVARKLAGTSMLLCAAPDYLARHGAPQRPEQLAQHVCVLDSNNPDGERWTIGSGDAAVKVPVRAGIQVNSARAARELLLAGHGIGYLPSFAVARDIAEGRLTRLLPEYPPQRHGIYGVYTHRKYLSAKVRLFVDAALDYCARATLE